MNGSDFSEIENSNVSEQHSDVYAENTGLEEVFMRLQNETDEDERRKLFV